MRRAKTKFPAVNPLQEDCKNFLLSPDWIEVMNTATIVPEPFLSLISSVGILKHGDDIYLPVMSKDHTDSEGHFVPTPETIVLSYL